MVVKMMSMMKSKLMSVMMGVMKSEMSVMESVMISVIKSEIKSVMMSVMKSMMMSVIKSVMMSGMKSVMMISYALRSSSMAAPCLSYCSGVDARRWRCRSCDPSQPAADIQIPPQINHCACVLLL